MMDYNVFIWESNLKIFKYWLLLIRSFKFKTCENIVEYTADTY